MNTFKGIDTTKVVVVGTGDKAHGIAHMYQCHAKKDNWCKLVFTEPLLTKKIIPFNEYVSVELPGDALVDADIIMLAIPCYALESFLVQNFSLLKKDCVLVDLTNAGKDTKDLKGALAALNIEYNRWVKALNDTGAVQELQHHVADKTKLSTQVCGPDEECVSDTVALAKELGYSTEVVPIDQYDALQVSQQTIGWEWIHATVVMVIMFLLTMIYVMYQVSGQQNFQWYTILARHSSKMFAWTSTYGFAFSLLPGTLTRLLHQIGCPFTTARVLIWGCNIRKHIGLLSLYFLFLHACLMLLLFGGEYFGFLLRQGRLEWNAEASMLAAVLSTSLFIITGIASLPSVGNAMNKSQFMLVFGPVVWTALSLGLMHIMFLGVPGWTATPRSPYSWSRGMPPVTLMSSVLPLMVMFLKALQVTMSCIIALKNEFGRLRTGTTSIHTDDLNFVPDAEV